MKKLVIIFLCLVSAFVSAQDKAQQDTLWLKLKRAHTPAQQVKAYFDLASSYFELDPKKSDSLAFDGQAIAEASRDRSLIVSAYLQDAARYLRNTNKKSNIEEARARVLKGLSISQREKNSELIVQCDNVLARTYRISGDIAKALQANSEAIALLPEIDNDSLKVQAYNSQGLSLSRKNDMVAAFKSYLTALTLAEESKKTTLLTACYEILVNFYVSLSDFEKAKDFAFKILNEDKRSGKSELLLFDYYRIAGVYASAKEVKMCLFYYDKLAHFADSLHNEDFKLQVKLGMVNLYLNTNHFKEGYDLIRKSPEIFSQIKKLGMTYELDKANGYIQMMLGRYDSSIYYYKRAEPFYLNNASPLQKFYFYSQYALLYRTMKQWDKAIACGVIAKETVEATGNLENLSDAVQTLDSLYMLKGDFTTAYKYHNQYQTLKDSLQKLSREKDLQSLEIDNENKRKERAQVQAEEELRKRHNLQYMAITVAIGAVFILLVALGIFKVSPGVVKAMGFFAFIFLFEFIILLADNQIHHLTHGEPWKVLLIKIGLIALLLPFHHWIEEKVVHYLIEKKLVLPKPLRRIIPASRKEKPE
jgi:tetratricopeptide (TPR) repeat protein